MIVGYRVIIETENEIFESVTEKIQLTTRQEWAAQVQSFVDYIREQRYVFVLNLSDGDTILLPMRILQDSIIRLRPITSDGSPFGDGGSLVDNISFVR